MTRSCHVAVALLLASSVLSAQDADRHLAREESDIATLNADVVAVVSGGEWTSAGRSGTYRLVVVSSGYEHVTSRLYVQWVEDPAGRDTPSRIVGTKNVLGASLFSLGVPVISRSQGRWQATVDGANSNLPPPGRGRWVVTLGSPGDARVRVIR